MSLLVGEGFPTYVSWQSDPAQAFA
jgi:hypothetical protein